MFPIRTILHPTDFSSCSRYAFRLADALARDHGAGLIILHVKQTLGPMVAFGMALAELEPAEYQEKLWETLRLFEVPDPKVHVEHRLAKGDAAREILRAAKETGCDLIVMGSHGRTGLKRVILGSVAEQVLRKAPCPVVTVTAPQYSAPVARPATASSTPAEVTPRPVKSAL